MYTKKTEYSIFERKKTMKTKTVENEKHNNKHAPNGTAEDIKIGILHSVDGYYVTNEGTKSSPNFHVWIPDLTHSVCDSAYAEISLAVCRCNYLAKHKLKAKYIKFGELY